MANQKSSKEKHADKIDAFNAKLRRVEKNVNHPRIKEFKQKIDSGVIQSMCTHCHKILDEYTDRFELGEITEEQLGRTYHKELLKMGY